MGRERAELSYPWIDPSPIIQQDRVAGLDGLQPRVTQRISIPSSIEKSPQKFNNQNRKESYDFFGEYIISPFLAFSHLALPNQ